MASCKFHLTTPVTCLERCLGNSKQYSFRNRVYSRGMNFVARLLLVQAINYCYLNAALAHMAMPWLQPFFSYFQVSILSYQRTTSCAAQSKAPRPGSAVREKSVETALRFEWEELGFTWGGVGRTERIPYHFPTCYLQRHKQILKLWVLILKCTAWNPLRVKC